MSCRYGKDVYATHKFPPSFEMRTSAGDGKRELYTCNNCGLATKIIFKVTRDGVPSVHEFIIEP